MDKVVEYNIGCFPELAVSGPIVMAVDGRLAFSFNAMRSGAGGRLEDARRAMVKVEPYLAFKFGHPNDEALPGHPLYDRGFEGVADSAIQAHQIPESAALFRTMRNL